MADYYWSRVPGRFLDKTTGEQWEDATFTGTVREWYETLIEVMIDVTLCAIRENGGQPMAHVSWRGDANIVLITEASVLFKPSTGNDFRGMIGHERGGVICNLPISSDFSLYGTGRIELLQWEGSPSERVIGSVTVQDYQIA